MANFQKVRPRKKYDWYGELNIDICLDDEPVFGQNEGEWGQFNGLESKDIRRVFIRKVYMPLY